MPLIEIEIKKRIVMDEERSRFYGQKWTLYRR